MYVCMLPSESLLLFRHTDEMIKKLKTAGLGYYVKANNTQHKFGMYVRMKTIMYAAMYLILLNQACLVS